MTTTVLGSGQCYALPMLHKVMQIVAGTWAPASCNLSYVISHFDFKEASPKLPKLQTSVALL